MIPLIKIKKRRLFPSNLVGISNYNADDPQKLGAKVFAQSVNQDYFVITRSSLVYLCAPPKLSH